MSGAYERPDAPPPRCLVRVPAHLATKELKEGTRCGLERDHEGDHEALYCIDGTWPRGRPRGHVAFCPDCGDYIRYSWEHYEGYSSQPSFEHGADCPAADASARTTERSRNPALRPHTFVEAGGEECFICSLPADHERHAVPGGGFVKHDGGKPRVDLLPADVLLECADIMAVGAAKYGGGNWEKGCRRSRYYAAAQRHLLAWHSGREADDETLCSHLSHAICCILILRGMELRGVGTDDRDGPPPDVACFTD